MDLRLADKRALVTGSSSGIGQHVAETLALEGASVAVHGRNTERLHEAVERIVRKGGRAVAVEGDLASDEGASSVARQATEQLGGVDILINNAGEFHARSWAETTPDQWNDLYNTNVVSAVRLIRLLSAPMRASGWGRLIQMSSVTANLPFAMWPDYGASKAALSNLTVSLAKELAGSGVTANAVAPGTIMSDGATPFFKDAFKRGGIAMPAEGAELETAVVQHLLQNPTGRPGQVGDISFVCAMLASPLSGFINGTVIHVDGGALPTFQ